MKVYITKTLPLAYNFCYQNMTLKESINAGIFIILFLTFDTHMNHCAVNFKVGKDPIVAQEISVLLLGAGECGKSTIGNVHF